VSSSLELVEADVIVLALEPGESPPLPLRAQPDTAARLPGVVLLGDEPASAWATRALRNGAQGALPRTATADQIIAAVLAVARGETAWPPRLCMALGRHLSREYRNRPRFSMLAGGVKYCLTRRKLELIRLVERGLTNKEIAAQLNLSEFTVKNHLRRIMKEVDADNRHQAVDAIRASGLLPVI
jgi:DNA-binding NarL/FixJ family response regulator